MWAKAVNLRRLVHCRSYFGYDKPEIRNPPLHLSITHISDGAFALSESFVILFVTPIRGGVTDEWGEGSQYIRLA